MKKSNKKLLLIMFAAIFAASYYVYATTILYDSEEVSFDNSSSGMSSTNVQDAIDEIYKAATSDCRIGYSKGTETDNTYICNKTSEVTTSTITFDSSNVSYDNSESGIESSTVQGALAELSSSLSERYCKVGYKKINETNTNYQCVITQLCKRATTLHTAICPESNAGCRSAGYYEGGKQGTSTIKYGNLGTSGEFPQPGDAFDCDVNNDGVWDPITERFYYVREKGDTSYLIYYSNVSEGVATTEEKEYPFSTQQAALDLGYTCTEERGCSVYGPLVAYEQLPSITQWSHPFLKMVADRNERFFKYSNEYLFEYKDKAACFILASDIEYACGVAPEDIMLGALEGRCEYFFENTLFDKMGSDYWLETITTNSQGEINNDAMVTLSAFNTIFQYPIDYLNAVRPVIKVLTSNLVY